MSYYRLSFLLCGLLVLGSCAIGFPQAEPGALQAANPKQWSRIGVQLYNGSQFYSDPIKLHYATNIGTTYYTVPVPSAGEPPKYLEIEFAKEIENQTGIETIVLKPFEQKTPWDEGLKTRHEKDKINAFVDIYIVSEGTYFPSNYTARSSLAVYIKIYEVPTGKTLWDVKQRAPSTPREYNLARSMNGWSYAPFSYGVYSHEESGMVDFVSQFNSKMYIGAYSSALKHIPRIVEELVSDMGMHQ